MKTILRFVAAWIAEDMRHLSRLPIRPFGERSPFRKQCKGDGSIASWAETTITKKTSTTGKGEEG